MFAGTYRVVTVGGRRLKSLNRSLSERNGNASAPSSVHSTAKRGCKPKPPKIPLACGGSGGSPCGSIRPEILESIQCQFGRAGGVLAVAVPQVRLDRPRILPVVGPVRSEPERESAGPDLEDLTGRMAPRQRATHRSEGYRSGARSRVTEFSAVWAYNPNL